MATAPSVAPVRDAPLRETTGDQTVNGVAGSARHPAWLRSLWHYDPNYDYDLEHHEYDEFRTTDPYYIEWEVRLSPTPEHSKFLSRADRNLEAFLDLRGRPCPLTREIMIQDLGALPAHPGLIRSRHRIEPDLALWPPGTVIAPDRVVSWREQGAPLLVLECLSPSTEAKDREDNPVIYDLMGVAEYWICSPSDRHPMFGYQRAEAGAWLPVEAGVDREAWSPVLQTRIRTHAAHGFQCRDPVTGNWVDMQRHLEAKGRAEGVEVGRAEGLEVGRTEGMEIGKAEGKREALLIENAHHWVLDVAFGEDGSRIRTGHAAHNMAILKRIAHNLLRQDTSLKVGIANKRLAAAWNKDYLCQLVGLKPKPV